MRIELIQPFINAADAVLGQMLQTPAEVREVVMQEDIYRRKGVAASVVIRGDLEGRIIFDLEPEAALRVAEVLAGAEAGAPEQVARETVCELANMVVGNAVTLLNNQGFRFKVFPPELHTADSACAGGIQSEALALCFETSCGRVHMNIALDYSRRETAAAGTVRP
jgi:chemotaxis protein CheX